MTVLKALIFDVDGTLAETEECHRQAFNQAFQEYGLDWHWSIDTYKELLKTAGGKERLRAWRDRIGSPVSDGLISELHQTKTALYGRLLTDGRVRLRPGVKEWYARWLNTHRPDLTPRYREFYGAGAYAPKEYRRRLAARINSGCTARRASPAAALSPAARASSTFRTYVRSRLIRLRLTWVRRAIFRVAFLADFVLAIDQPDSEENDWPG